MRTPAIRTLLSATLLLQALGPSAAGAIVYRPPTTLFSPLIQVPSQADCRWTLSHPGGRSDGAAIPVPALRLGAPVTRATMSFTTGGSGTANAAWMLRQKEAGLPYEPHSFDLAGEARPIVFVDAAQPAQRSYAYQRLPLVPAGHGFGEMALVHALPDGRQTGRIVSVQMALPAAPKAPPRYRLTGEGKCHGGFIDIYGNMRNATLATLSNAVLCPGLRPGDCEGRPALRGRLLYVVKLPGAERFTHRWIDNDALHRTRTE
jgi:hypothetical protein